MLCPNCGTEVGDNATLCTSCIGQEAPGLLPEEHSTKVQVATIDGSPAGLWLRTMAAMIDISLVYICQLVLTRFIISPSLGFSVHSKLQKALHSDHAFVGFLPFVNQFMPRELFGFMLSSFTITALFAVLYFAILESSDLQATPGKLLCGLRVVDGKGRAIFFFDALLRFLYKFISAAPLGLGFLIIICTSKKQALHDMMSKTFVQKSTRLTLVEALIVSLFAITFAAIAPIWVYEYLYGRG